jgi:heavy metal translocating P-type ATPase
LADVISGYFVPIVILISLQTFILWIAFGYSLIFALLNAVSVLIIACPCALGLATPVAIIVGTGKAAESGILIKNAESLEKAKDLDILIFDKTGTLTLGQPKVINYSSPEVFKIAAALESKSEHPLAKAVFDTSKELKIPLDKVSDFVAEIGLGVFGVINNERYYLGNQEFLNKNKIKISDEDLMIIASEEHNAKTVLLLADHRQFLGYIALADPIKEGAQKAIKVLEKFHITPVLLTGDNQRTAEVIAALLNIEKWQAKVKPEEKLAKVKEFQAQGLKVGMVGDGINDAPALTQANVGIAMGTGTDIAIESAQIVILKGDISKIVKTILLSKKTMSTIKGNLFWAFVYNILGIPIAAGVLYPKFGFLLSPMIAAATMAFSSIFVILNSLRLKKSRVLR